MAPEVLCGKQYSFPADVYSVGITISEILMRQRPYADQRAFPEGNLPAEAQYVLAGNRPSLPADAPRVLRKLVEVCWDADPGKRPTAAQLVAFAAAVPFTREATVVHNEAVDKAVEELFDAMISYCWANKELGHALADELIASGLKVWIDRSEMRGNVFEAMADGVKKSKVCVCVCARCLCVC